MSKVIFLLWWFCCYALATEQFFIMAITWFDAAYLLEQKTHLFFFFLLLTRSWFHGRVEFIFFCSRMNVKRIRHFFNYYYQRLCFIYSTWILCEYEIVLMCLSVDWNLFQVMQISIKKIPTCITWHQWNVVSSNYNCFSQSINFLLRQYITSC